MTEPSILNQSAVLSAATFRPSWCKDAMMLSAPFVPIPQAAFSYLTRDDRQPQHMLSRRYEHWDASLSPLILNIYRNGPKSLCISSQMRVMHLVNREPPNCLCK